MQQRHLELPINQILEIFCSSQQQSREVISVPSNVNDYFLPDIEVLSQPKQLSGEISKKRSAVRSIGKDNNKKQAPVVTVTSDTSNPSASDTDNQANNYDAFLNMAQPDVEDNVLLDVLNLPDHLPTIMDNNILPDATTSASPFSIPGLTVFSQPSGPDSLSQLKNDQLAKLSGR